MDLGDVETKGETSVHLLPPLVRSTEKTANERKCTQEER